MMVRKCIEDLGMFTHDKSVWQVAKDPYFANIVKEVEVTGNSKEVEMSGLDDYTIYFVRVKAVSNGGTETPWSDTVRFRTLAYWDGKFRFDGSITFGGDIK